MSSTGGPILYAAWIFFAPEPWSRWAGHIWSMPSRMETRWPLRTLVSSHIWEGTWVRNILGIPWVCHKGCFGFLLVCLNFGESGFPKISGWFPGSMRLYESPFNLMKPQIPSSKDCLSQILERAAPRASGCKSSQAFGKTRGELCRGVSKRQSWERSKCQHVTHPSNVVQYSTMCPKMLEVCQSLLQALLVRSCEFDAGHN